MEGVIAGGIKLTLLAAEFLNYYFKGTRVYFWCLLGWKWQKYWNFEIALEVSDPDLVLWVLQHVFLESQSLILAAFLPDVS